MTLTPTKGTTADWNAMASVNGTPSFLTLALTLKGCSKRYERFCQQHRHHAKGAPKCHWGSRMLKRLVETSGNSRSKKKRISPGQQHLLFAFDLRLN